MKLNSLKNIKVDDKISYSYHDNKYNKDIFNILKFEEKDFYNYTNVKRPKTINDIDKYFSEEKEFFDIFYNDEIVGVREFNSKNNHFSNWVSSKFHNLGIASKVLKDISDKILSLGIDKIYVNIQKDNTGSIRVAEKSGFILEKEQVFDGDDVMLLYSKSR